jgi:hypothetical protein
VLVDGQCGNSFSAIPRKLISTKVNAHSVLLNKMEASSHPDAY